MYNWAPPNKTTENSTKAYCYYTATKTAAKPRTDVADAREARLISRQEITRLSTKLTQITIVNILSDSKLQLFGFWCVGGQNKQPADAST